jgi:hypothetical protein
MRLMPMIRLFAISGVLLGGTPAFAARSIHADTHDIRHEHKVELFRSPSFNVERPSAVGETQAQANAASKVWPGDMILD